MASGQGFRVGRLVETVRRVRGTPHSRQSLYQAALPLYMNYGDQIVKAVDFVSPLQSSRLEDILVEQRQKCSFIDFTVLHKMHPRRLAVVQLPAQLLVLRVMEAMMSLEADEYRGIVGRIVQSTTSLGDIIGYLLQSTVSDDHKVAKLGLNGYAEKEYKQAMQVLVKERDPALLLSAIKTHGIDSLILFLNPAINTILDYLHVKWNIDLPKQPSHKIYTVSQSSPHRYGAFLLKTMSSIMRGLGLNIPMDLSKIIFDLSLEQFIASVFDTLRLLYAMMQSLVEREATQWLSDNPGKSFTDYIKHVKSLDSNQSAASDPFKETIRAVFRDQRQRALLVRFMETTGRFLDLSAPQFWPKANREKWIAAVQDHRQFDKVLPPKLASGVIYLIDHPEDMLNAGLRFAMGQPLEGSWSSHLTQIGVNLMVVNQMDWFAVFTTVFGFRLFEYEAMYRFCTVLYGSDPLTDHQRQHISTLPVPLWSLMYRAPLERLSLNIDALWVSLMPILYTVPDLNSGKMLSMMPIPDLLDKLCKSVSNQVSRLAINSEPRPSLESITSVTSLPALLLSIANLFGGSNYLATMVSTQLALPHHHHGHLSAFISDIGKGSQEGAVMQTVAMMWQKWPQLVGRARGWRVNREAIVLSRLSEGENVVEMRIQHGSRLYRNIVRTILVGLSGIALFYSGKLLYK